MPLTSATLCAAQGDAWQVQGELRRPSGGDASELPGVRLMASGLPQPQWNNGSVEDPDLVDLGAVTDWYAERAQAWGLTLPAAASWPHGRLLFRQRLMGLDPRAFRAAPEVEGLEVRTAGPADLDAVLQVDATAFGSDAGTERPWLEPHLRSERVEVALGLLDGSTLATAYVVRSDGRAGAAAFLGGVCVLPEAEGRGIGSAVSSWLVARALDAGAGLVHLNPDSDRAAAVYRRLGFVEVDGLDVYVENGRSTA